MTPIHQRLTQAFTVVWSRLPDDVRDVLNGNVGWELTDDIRPLEDGRAVWAECRQGGLIVVAADQVGHLDDDLLAALIGHELAHRLMILQGDPDSADEDRADGLVREWGFAIDGLRSIAAGDASKDTGGGVACVRD